MDKIMSIVSLTKYTSHLIAFCGDVKISFGLKCSNKANMKTSDSLLSDDLVGKC